MTRGPESVQLGVLALLGILLATMELMFQFAYLGAVPLPLGTLGVLLSMPWLVRTTVEAWPGIAGAAAQPVLWFLTTTVFGAFGPGGDALLVPTWQTLLLLATGVVVGVVSFRRAVERLAATPPDPDARSRPSDPRIGKAGSSL